MSARVAILITNLAGGGAERVCVNVANTLVRRGVAVDMVLLRSVGAFLKLLDPRVNVVELSASRIRHSFLPLVKYLRSAKPNAMMANIWPLTAMAVAARIVSRVSCNVVAVEHSTWSKSELLSRRFVEWLARTSMRSLFLRAGAVVTVSRGAADDLAIFARIPRDRIAVIYNPIVGDRVLAADSHPIAPREWSEGEHHKLLAVGTLKSIKDYSTLLRSVAVLRRTTDTKLLILGEGDLRSSLVAEASNLGIAESVFLPGFVDRLGPYYEAADVHVLSSIAEGFGNVIVEALNAGTPVVSTDCPSGPREILADGRYGRLVPVGDADALAKAISESLHASHDVAALKARAQDFSIDEAVDQYVELLLPVESRKAK